MVFSRPNILVPSAVHHMIWFPEPCNSGCCLIMLICQCSLYWKMWSKDLIPWPQGCFDGAENSRAAASSILSLLLVQQHEVALAFLAVALLTYTSGNPPKWNLFIKNYVFFRTCLNFSQLQSTLHLMQCTYQDVFSTAPNSFWICWYWCLLVLLQFFCFTSSTLVKHFPLMIFFIQGR